MLLASRARFVVQGSRDSTTGSPVAPSSPASLAALWSSPCRLLKSCQLGAPPVQDVLAASARRGLTRYGATAACGANWLCLLLQLLLQGDVCIILQEARLFRQQDICRRGIVCIGCRDNPARSHLLCSVGHGVHDVTNAPGTLKAPQLPTAFCAGAQRRWRLSRPVLGAAAAAAAIGNALSLC